MLLGGVVHAGERVAEEPFRIVASFYPIWLAVRNVAGGIEGVDVVNLTRPTVGCLHDYALTPEDMKRLSGASVLVINGLGMESFLDRLLQSVSVPIVDASQSLRLPEQAVQPAHRHDEDDEEEGGDHHAGDGHRHELGPNPHVWLSLTLHIGQVSNIMAGLSRLDPGRSSRYRAKGERYIEQLAALRDRLRESVRPLASRTLITFHPAFEYFAREFDLRVAAVVTADPSVMPASGEMARLIRLIREEKIRGIFMEPNTPRRVAETLAREAGIRTAILDPITSGSEEDDFYLRRMEQNVRTLREVLGTVP